MAANWDRRGLAEHRRVQDLTTGRWIQAVAAYSRFWNDHLRSAGVDPASVESAAELSGIPPVRELDVRDVGGPGSPALVLRPTEEDLKAAGDLGDLLAVARRMRGGADSKRRALLWDWKPIHLVASGRDGLLAISYTRSDLDRLHRSGARTASVLGMSDRDYLVSAVPAGASLGFWAVRHLALGSSVLATHTRGAGQGVEGSLEGFSLVPATAVAVPLDEAIELAETVADSGVDASAVTRVVVVGPPPSDDERGAIAEAWAGATVLAAWAPTGARHLWAECAESGGSGDGPGLHTYPDLEVVEVLDPSSGRRAERGGGDLTLTSIGWHGSALVRYQTGDFVAGTPEDPCPWCGRSVPRVTGPIIPGAWEPVLDGDRRLDLRGVAAVLGGDQDVRAWRVEVRRGEGRRRDEGYVVEIATDASADQLSDLDQRIAEAVGQPPTQLVVEDDATIAERTSAVGSVFEDSR